MRYQLLKLTKYNSTKVERKIAEILKNNRIPFKTKWRVKGHEVDFLIGRVIIEIDGKTHNHLSSQREKLFIDAGYVPFHISTVEIRKSPGVIEQKLIYFIKQNNENFL